MRKTIQKVKEKIPKDKIEMVKARLPDRRRIKEKAMRKFVSFWLLIFGSLGYFVYKDPVIIELGVIGAGLDLFYEYFGTKWGWWSYDPSSSHHMIAGRLPIGVVFTYFVMGMVGASYVLFRIS